MDGFDEDRLNMQLELDQDQDQEFLFREDEDDGADPHSLHLTGMP